MRSPLAESQREALIEAMLPDVAFDGWSRAALRTGARRIGIPAEEVFHHRVGVVLDRTERQAAQCSDKLLELVGYASVDGPMSGIMGPWRDLIDEQVPGLGHEHLDCQNAD